MIIVVGCFSRLFGEEDVHQRWMEETQIPKWLANLESSDPKGTGRCHSFYWHNKVRAVVEPLIKILKDTDDFCRSFASVAIKDFLIKKKTLNQLKQKNDI